LSAGKMSLIFYPILWLRAVGKSNTMAEIAG